MYAIGHRTGCCDCKHSQIAVHLPGIHRICSSASEYGAPPFAISLVPTRLRIVSTSPFRRALLNSVSCICVVCNHWWSRDSFGEIISLIILIRKHPPINSQSSTDRPSLFQYCPSSSSRYHSPSTTNSTTRHSNAPVKHHPLHATTSSPTTTTRPTSATHTMRLPLPKVPHHGTTLQQDLLLLSLKERDTVWARLKEGRARI